MNSMKMSGIIFFVLSFLLTARLSYGQSWKEDSDSAAYYIKLGKPDQAIVFYQKAKAAIPADSVSGTTYVQLSKGIANIFFSTRQYDQAFQTGMEIKTATGQKHGEMNLDYAWACNLLGAVYNLRGELDSALIIHNKAKEIRQKLLGNKDPFYAQSCNNMGALYRDLGKYDLAEPLLLEAKNIREKLTPARQNDPFAITCISLANLYRDMGQFERSEQLYLQAKERRALAGKENGDYARSCNILADLYAYMGKYNEAESLYIEAKNIRAIIDSGGYEYGQSCNNLAALYREMRLFEKAEPLALEAKSIYEEELEEDDPSRTIQLNNLGELYYAMGRYKEASGYFLQARTIWEKELGKEHPYFIANTEELARVYRNMHETAAAARLFNEVSKLKYEQLEGIFRFTSETEKQLYLQNISGTADEYQSFYFNKMDHNKAAQPYTLSLRNRNLILSSGQQVRQTIYKSKDSVLMHMYNEWAGMKRQLAHLYSQGSSAKFEQAAMIEKKANEIEKELSRRSTAFRKLQTKTGWQDIQQKLLPGEAAVEFIQFRLNNDRRESDSIMYVALVLKKNIPEPVMVPLFEEKTLVRFFDYKTTAEEEQTNHYYSSPALFNIVWKPLEKHLTGISTIYFAPAGQLFRISFCALAMDDKRVLCDKYKLQQVTTTAAITSRETGHITRTGHIMLYGGIVYDADTTALKQSVAAYRNGIKVSRSLPEDLTRGKSFRYLPGTLEETAAIQKQALAAGMTVSVLSGMQASEESFMSLGGEASPAVLHIATHGFFFPDPQKDARDTLFRQLETSGRAFRESADPLMRAGLLFAGANNTWRGRVMNGMEDGIVTAYEAGTMYLPNTKLVVLSACETALGDVDGGEGVYGLQRAFRMAGVENLVMSLWKVPDAETAVFMQTLYKNLFNRQSITDAFYQAQGAMKKLYRNEPYKWAAWVLVR
ncbi:MAG: CHAT domain-containing protein [Chitinophagaceae bacterium]|nr:CHAT domain-containing protein [Chitinophagaceae bacterium]